MALSEYQKMNKWQRLLRAFKYAILIWPIVGILVYIFIDIIETIIEQKKYNTP